MTILRDLEKELKRSIKKFQVPGASIGILRNGRVTSAAAGVINLDTNVKTTVDTAFQIGSITKIFTTTLIMQLVEEGKLGLDDPVIKHLPDFRVERYDVSRKVTIRNFLSHTSGIDGDLFVESGRGDDAIKRFVDKCTMVPSLFEPGDMMSYCNLGFAVLGRIIELQRNKTFDQALKDHIFDPLGMQQAFSNPDDALRFRSAIGHIPSRKKNRWNVTRIPFLSFGQKAAGSTPAMSVIDLLAFAQMHLESGKNKQGDRILSAKSVRTMQQRQIKLNRHVRTGVEAWGLGWFLLKWDNKKLIGHDGATIGQFAFLRILPEKNIAVALLTNGGDAQGLYEHMFDRAFHSLARISEPRLPNTIVQPSDLAPYAGQYANIMNTIDLVEHDNKLFVQSSHKDSGQLIYPENTELVFVDKNVARPNTGNALLDRNVFVFSQLQDSQARYVQVGTRQHLRV